MAQILAVLIADVAPLRGAAAVDKPVTTEQEQQIDHHFSLNFTSCFRKWYKFMTLKQLSWLSFLGDKASTFLGIILTLQFIRKDEALQANVLVAPGSRPLHLAPGIPDPDQLHHVPTIVHLHSITR